MASLQHEIIDERHATVAYLRGDMQPCEPEQAERIKVMFDDGDVMWLTGPKLVASDEESSA